ncbi:MAG: Stk1 family PASTA domain-containing Ser/Thr kinase [Bacilli bacterium]|nr:Stk1 family PASTA domain-containing Ser/Thr kinase [Bacilli bacterium]
MIVKGAKINDRYQIIKTLGEGGMANVYLAHDTILDRSVAVKVLRGDLASDDKFVRRFQREALSASSLSHQNIVEMYDVGEDDGQYYIVMEYVDGKTLKQLLKVRGRLSLTEVIDIMLQLTDGMAHAHDSYIIHRDIKPQNIMILSNGVIKITDFGVATALNSTQLTQTNSVMGTVHYLPPEQANGKGSTIKSDIYSMGILMYELLSGSVPYKGDSAVEIALKHLKEPLPSIRKENSSIPQSLENIIIKSTAKNPKNRYKDAREMHEDLKTALDESRVNEPRYVYPYAENDLENTKALDNELEIIKKKEEEKTKKEVAKIEEEMFVENKKQNKLLIVLLSIFTSLIIITTVIIILYFKKGDVKDVLIPDVSGYTTVKAANTLTDAGFEVNTDYKYVASDVYEEGYVVKTSPEIGRKVKEGTVITIYLSSGDQAFTIEDYKGKNYLEVKGKLEEICDCNVTVETEKVDEEDKVKEDIVLKTSPAAGESVKIGEAIVIYIPEVEYKYPDFTSGYTLEQIEKFAEKHELNVDYKYVTDDTLAEGTIISQSRAPKSVVTPKANLTITISRKTEEEPEEELPEEPEGNIEEEPENAE